jgi:hypothetical protein
MKVTIEEGPILTISAESITESCALKYLFEKSTKPWNENILIDYSYNIKRRHDDKSDD